MGGGERKKKNIPQKIDDNSVDSSVGDSPAQTNEN